VNIFLYLDRGTWVHRLDPRSKIVAVLLLFSLCLSFNHPLYMGAVTLAILTLAVSAQALANFWRLRFILGLLFVFSALMWPFFAKGPTPFWSWGPLSASRESLFYGIAMGLRLSSFVMAGLLLLSTTRNEEMTHGLIGLGIPYPVAFAFSTALRLIPTLAGAGATIIQAQVSRGLDLESGNIFRRMGKFIPQAIPLFLYAIRYTNLLAIALESRGFSPGAKRTFYYELRLTKADYGVILLLSLLLATALYLRLGMGLGAVLPGRL
jgi:energy-coupling factor transport system permease protein